MAPASLRSRRGRLLAGGLLAAALLYPFFRGVDWAAFMEAFRSAHPAYMLAVVGVTVGTYAARAWRWGYLLAPLGRVPFSRLFSATLVGFMSGLLIPRAGEVVRPYLVARSHDMRISAAFASIVLERLVDLITVVALFSLYLYVLPAPSAQRGGALVGLLKTGGAVAGTGATALLLLLLAFHVHADRALALLEHVLSRAPGRLAGPFMRALRSFGEGLAVLQAPGRHLVAIAAQSLLVWLSIALGIYLNNRAFGLDLPFRSAFLIVGFLTVGVAVPTPGMVGGFHESYLLALTEAFGVDKSTAAAAGVAAHALSNLPVLVLGLLFLGGEGLTFGKVAEMTKETAKEPAGAPSLSAPSSAGRQTRSARSAGSLPAEPGFTSGETEIDEVAEARTRSSGVRHPSKGRGTPRLNR